MNKKLALIVMVLLLLLFIVVMVIWSFTTIEKPTEVPVAPTDRCGDAICSANENQTSCPSDCYVIEEPVQEPQKESHLDVICYLDYEVVDEIQNPLRTIKGTLKIEYPYDVYLMDRDITDSTGVVNSKYLYMGGSAYTKLDFMDYWMPTPNLDAEIEMELAFVKSDNLKGLAEVINPGKGIVCGYINLSKKIELPNPQDIKYSEEVPCKDTDGGDNKFIRGTVTGGSYGVIGYDHGPFTDYCSTGFDLDELHEYYCTEADFVQVRTYECPNGCKDGACESD
jgi:hypothetical protein